MSDEKSEREDAIARESAEKAASLANEKIKRADSATAKAHKESGAPLTGQPKAVAPKSDAPRSTSFAQQLDAERAGAQAEQRERLAFTFNKKAQLEAAAEEKTAGESRGKGGGDVQGASAGAGSAASREQAEDYKSFAEELDQTRAKEEGKNTQPVVNEPGKAQTGQHSSPLPRYSSHSSPETAAKNENGTVYRMKGYEEHAIIVQDDSDRMYVYVRQDSPRYREIANVVSGEKEHGQRIAQHGKDADHVASRAVSERHGQDYVLLAAVDSGANRAHGGGANEAMFNSGTPADKGKDDSPASREHDPAAGTERGTERKKKGGTLRREFRPAASGARGDRSEAISHDEIQKIQGKRPSEYDPKQTPEIDRQRVSDATFGSDDCQRRLKDMRGEEVRSPDRSASPEHKPTRDQPFSFSKPAPAKFKSTQQEHAPRNQPTGPGFGR